MEKITESCCRRCCWCHGEIAGDEWFHFRRCLNEHGRWAHRVCPACWWDIIVPVSETTHLECPGCTSESPLAPP